MHKTPRIFVAIQLILLCGIATVSALGQTEGGTLTWAADVEAASLDARYVINSTEDSLQELVYSSLIKIGVDGSVVPSLAESWDWSGTNEWVFHLRKGVKFHDDVELTAEDVKFTYDTILGPDSESKLVSRFNQIVTTEVVDPYTVRFILKSPYASFIYQVWNGIVPKHVVEAVGSQDFGRNPVGSGPFKFVSWSEGEEIVVERFDGYFEGKPHLDKIEIKIIPDANTRVISLQSGNVDLIEFPILRESLTLLERDPNINLLRNIPSSYLNYLSLNCGNEKLQDKRVRQAISWLVDKQLIVDTVYQGTGVVAHSPLGSTNWAYADDVEKYGYDPNRASELLAEAGWQDTDGDKWLDDGTAALEFEIKTHPDTERTKVAQYLQGELGKIGVKASVKVLDWPSFSNDFIVTHNFEIAVIGFSNLYDPDFALAAKFIEGAGQNWNNYSNPEVTTLLTEAAAETEIERQREVYQQAQRILMKDAPWVPLLFNEYMVATRDYVKGIIPNGARTRFVISLATAWLEE